MRKGRIEYRKAQESGTLGTKTKKTPEVFAKGSQTIRRRSDDCKKNEIGGGGHSLKKRKKNRSGGVVRKECVGQCVLEWGGRKRGDSKSVLWWWGGRFETAGLSRERSSHKHPRWAVSPGRDKKTSRHSAEERRGHKCDRKDL